MPLIVKQRVKKPRFLVITPLRIEDEITKELDESIGCNKEPFDWVLYRGDNNIPQNTQNGLIEYCKKYKEPKYFIKVDNDIIFKTAALDIMYKCLLTAPSNVAYSYSSFAYVGNVTYRFGADKFDINRLCENNYISSVSMIKMKAFKKVGGFITTTRLVRLLDWCQWLWFFRHGFIGQACPSAYFEAMINNNSISSGSAEDFHNKRKLVIEEYVEPLKRMGLIK